MINCTLNNPVATSNYGLLVAAKVVRVVDHYTFELFVIAKLKKVGGSLAVDEVITEGWSETDILHKLSQLAKEE